MTTKPKLNSGEITRLIATIITIIVTLLSVAFAIATQNERLNNACEEQTKIKEKVELHDKSITTIETKMDYIVKGVDEIKAEMKRK